MYIKRKQEEYLKNIIEDSTSPHSVLLIEGARQTGKTTLTKKVLSNFSNVIEINLEKNKTIRKEIDECSSFKEFELCLSQTGLNKDQKQILFIDEAQESEQLGSFIRFMKEDWPNTISILSGSSMTRLFRDNTRIPVGRIQRYLVQPLSFFEFLSSEKFSLYADEIKRFKISKQSITPFTHKKLLELCDLYLEIGGLPEVVTSYLQERDYQKVRKEILINQEDDFLRKAKLENFELFMLGIRAVANHLGGVSKYTHISQKLVEAKQISQLLSSWKLTYEIEQRTFTSTTTLPCKRYLYDLGIAQLVRNQPFPKLSILNTNNSDLRNQLGGLFENFVLISSKEYKLGAIDITGWKESSGNAPEVDFVIRHNKLVIPIECKATLKVNRRNFSSLKIYLNKSGLKLGILVSAAPFEIFKEAGIVIVNVPLYLFGLEFVLGVVEELG